MPLWVWQFWMTNLLCGDEGPAAPGKRSVVSFKTGFMSDGFHWLRWGPWFTFTHGELTLMAFSQKKTSFEKIRLGRWLGWWSACHRSVENLSSESQHHGAEELDSAVYGYNLSTGQVETGGSLEFPGQPDCPNGWGLVQQETMCQKARGVTEEDNPIRTSGLHTCIHTTQICAFTHTCTHAHVLAHTLARMHTHIYAHTHSESFSQSNWNNVAIFMAKRGVCACGGGSLNMTVQLWSYHRERVPLTPPS